MELKEFRTLLEIERLGSISLAAKSLYISQPGLSQFLQNYEHQLGFPVFEGQFQGMRPTQRGGEYLRMIRELVGTYDMSLAELRGENRRRIRFGIGDQRGSLVIPKIIAKMNEKDHGFKKSCWLCLRAMHLQSIYGRMMKNSTGLTLKC